MPDLSLSGLAAFSQIPSQLAANYVAPGMNQAKLLAAQLQNQGTQNYLNYQPALLDADLAQQQEEATRRGIINKYLPDLQKQGVLAAQLQNMGTEQVLPYLGPQAAANVGLTGAQTRQAGAQANLLGTQARYYPASLGVQMVNSALSTPAGVSMLLPKLGLMLQNLQNAGGTNNISGNDIKLSNYANPDMTSTDNNVSNNGNALNIRRPDGSLASPQEIKAALNQTPTQSTMPTLPGKIPDSNKISTGLLAGTTDKDNADLNDTAKAYITKMTAPVQALDAYNNGKRLWESYKIMEEALANHPNALNKYIGIVGNPIYKGKEVSSILSSNDPDYNAIKAIEDNIGTFAGQKNRFFISSHSHAAEQNAEKELQNMFNAKATPTTALNAMRMYKNILLAELKSTANSTGLQQDFQKETGYPADYDFATNPVLPKIKDQNQMINYLKSLNDTERNIAIKQIMQQQAAAQGG